MNAKKQIKFGAILSYVSIAVNILAGLIYTPWMIRQIGQSQYGLYTLANSLIALFLVDFGLSSATARYVSKYRAEGDQQKVNNFLGVIYKLYLIIDAIIFIVLLVIFLLIEQIYVNLTPAELEQFKVVYVIAAFFAIFNFPFVTQNGILTAYEKFVPLKLADLIYRFLLVGLTIVALILGYGLYALVTVHAIVGLIIIVFKFIVVKKDTPIKANFKYKDKTLYKDIFKFSIWSTVALFAQRLVFNITPTVLGITASAAAIGVFGVVVAIEGYSYTITTAINGLFMPKISRVYADMEKNGEDEEAAGKNLAPLLLGVGKFQFALNGLIVVGFAVVGKLFINLWVGPDYADAYYGILLVIVPGMFFNSLQIANTTMVVRNKVKLQAIINVATGITNIILSFILSYFWGVVGACISISVAYSIRAILTNIVAQKSLKFNIIQFAKSCYIRMSIPLIFSLAIGILINYLFVGSNIWALLIKAVIIATCYLAFVFVFGLNKQEKSKVLKRFKIVKWNKKISPIIGLSLFGATVSLFLLIGVLVICL